MKSTIYHFVLILTLIVVFTSQLSARILTVTPPSLPQVAQYNTLQAAHDAAQNGDTIYIYPALTSYKGAVISKKITILGAGFNKVTDYSDCSKIASADTLTFDAGSEGSLISSIIGNYKIRVKASNIVIQRCKIWSIKLEENLSDIMILDCIINNRSSTINDDSTILVSSNSFALISNNIIIGRYDNVIGIRQAGSALIKNNIIFAYNYSITCSNSKDVLIINNISISGSGYALSSDAIVQNSPNLNRMDNDGNLIDKSWFLDYDNGNYHLNDSSSAKSAGTDGKDLGIYGGDYPFIDDGAPNLPTVYYIKIPSTGSQKDGLSVEIEAKTNK